MLKSIRKKKQHSIRTDKIYPITPVNQKPVSYTFPEAQRVAHGWIRAIYSIDYNKRCTKLYHLLFEPEPLRTDKLSNNHYETIRVLKNIYEKIQTHQYTSSMEDDFTYIIQHTVSSFPGDLKDINLSPNVIKRKLDELKEIAGKKLSDLLIINNGYLSVLKQLVHYMIPTFRKVIYLRTESLINDIKEKKQNIDIVKRVNDIMEPMHLYRLMDYQRQNNSSIDWQLLDKLIFFAMMDVDSEFSEIHNIFPIYKTKKELTYPEFNHLDLPSYILKIFQKDILDSGIKYFKADRCCKISDIQELKILYKQFCQHKARFLKNN